MSQLREHTTTHQRAHIINKIKQYASGVHKVDITSILCSVCAKPLENLADLRSHLTLKHDVTFTSHSDNLIPFKLEKNTYNCEVCLETFKHFNKLNVHMNSHYQNFICEICGIGFSSLLNLKKHTRRHVNKTYKCDECKLEFATLYKRDQHNIEAHKRLLRRICLYCPERFKGHYARLVHMIKKHNIEKPQFKCDSCDRIFLRKFLLNAHTRKFHMSERKHECSVCGIKFFNKYDLSQHTITHTGEKNFTCTLCGKSYARKYSLHNHLKIHNKA